MQIYGTLAMTFAAVGAAFAAVEAGTGKHFLGTGNKHQVGFDTAELATSANATVC